MKKIKDIIVWIISLILVLGIMYCVCRVLSEQGVTAVIICIVVGVVFILGTIEEWNKNQDDNE